MDFSASVLGLGRWTNRSAGLVDREIDEELDFHIECRTRDLMESGMSFENAVEEANRQFGGRARIRRECQTIGYGRNVWLIIILSCGFLVSVAAIGWLTHLLHAANQQNQQMLALVHSLQPVQDAKNGLTGEITDEKGQPVSGARVLLIFKSWPGGQYQQQGLNQTSDEAGKFRFPELYSSSMQTAFLVTILAEGRAMQSEYVLYKAKSKVKPFRFKLQTAIEKTFIVHDKSGKPVADTIVFPSTRKPEKSDDEFMMYDQSAESAGYRTDAAGKVRMALFAPGDSVQLGIVDGDPIDLIVDNSPEQKVGAGKGAGSTSGIQGKVLNTSREPIVDAKVLLILKSWPGGRFQQRPAETVTKADGSFAFPEGNQRDGKEAFLVTVVKEGLAFQSRYVMKKTGEQVEPIEFQLTAAVDKTFLLRDVSGRPLINTLTALSGRKDAAAEEHLIYGVSAPSVSFKTDKDGKVALKFFSVGDVATLAVETSEGTKEIEFKVDEKPEQSVDVKKKATRQ